MDKESKRVLMAFHVEEDVRDLLKDSAEGSGVSVSEVVRKLVYEFLELPTRDVVRRVRA